jgi:putative transposase
MARSFLTDSMWERLAPLLPPETGGPGPHRISNRLIVEAILWKHRTGAPWRDMPSEFPPWETVFTRFNRWSKRGVWHHVMLALEKEDPGECIMLDGSSIRAHQHSAGQKGGARNSVVREAGSLPRSTCWRMERAAHWISR